MFVAEVKGHDQHCWEIIVKFWLIDDVSRSGTCFHNEINILSAPFPDHFHFRYAEYEVSPLPLATPRKSQFALPRVRVFVNVLMRKRVSVWRSLASEKVSKLFLWCMSSGSLRQTAWYYIIKASSWPQPLENGIYVKSYVCFKHISNDLFSISSSEPSASFICVKYQRHDPIICKIGFIFSWSQWK